MVFETSSPRPDHRAAQCDAAWKQLNPKGPRHGVNGLR